jgi:hypothetical protein
MALRYEMTRHAGCQFIGLKAKAASPKACHFSVPEVVIRFSPPWIVGAFPSLQTDALL